MMRSLRHLVLLGIAAATVAACADDPQQPSQPESATTKTQGITPDAIPQSPARRLSVNLDPSQYPAECSLSSADQQKAIAALLPQLFGPGGGRRGTAQGYQNEMDKAVKAGDYDAAQYWAGMLINYTLSNYFAGTLQGRQSTSTQALVLQFIYLIQCYVNAEPLQDLSYIFGTQNTTLIQNTTPTTVVTDENKFAGVKINTGDVPALLNGEPFFGTYVSVVKTDTDLPTSLDWYGIDGFKLGAFEFTANPAVEFTNPVLTGVCINYDDAVVTNPSDLRLAHQVAPGYSSGITGNYTITTAGGTIEILAPASATPLGICPDFPQVAVTSFERTVDFFARIVLPQKLYARRGTSGTKQGGTVATFSPFAVVDTRLATTSAGPSGTKYIPLGSTYVDETVSLTVKTRKGNSPVDGIPVAFATGPSSGSFLTSPVATGTDGTASSTWRIPAGTGKTATATPSRSPLSFTPASASFTVDAVQETDLVFAAGNALSEGTVGQPYRDTLQATGGIGTYEWSPTAFAPGLTLNASTGIITGTPTTAGTFNVNVTVKSGSQEKTQSYQLKVNLPAVSFTPTSFSSTITVGAAYSQTFIASGGAGSTGTYTFALASGTLPSGLSLSTAGVLSGTPTIAGETRTFGITVTSSDGTNSVTSAPQSYTLTTANASRINLAFANNSAPSRNVCYAVNKPLNPSVQVLITDGSGRPLSGITAGIVAVLNNGSKVQVNPSTATSGADGIANFGGPVINQTGTFVLEITVTTPASAVLRSAKFNVVPAC